MEQKGTKLESFHGKQEIKEKYILRMKDHMAQDELVQGTGFDKIGGKVKGCAVGCTLDRYSHEGYEEELGVPFLIALLEDEIFELLPWDQAKTFPLEFLEAIPVGKNLDNVWRKFYIWRLTEMWDVKPTEEDKKITNDLVALLQKGIDGIPVTEEEWKNVAYLAYLAYRADRAYRADLADLADLAYRAYLADRADRADRAYLADRADRADRAKYAPAMRAKLIELLKAA